MIMTYDFLRYAEKSSEFKNQIKWCIADENGSELHTEIHKLRFDGKAQMLVVEPLSQTSPFKEKIVPKAIPYDVLEKLLDGCLNELDNPRITTL